MKQRITTLVLWLTKETEDTAKAFQQVFAWLLGFVVLIGSLVFMLQLITVNPKVWSAFLNASLAKIITGLVVFFSIMVWLELATPGRTLRAIFKCDDPVCEANPWVAVGFRAVAALFILGIMHEVARIIIGA